MPIVWVIGYHRHIKGRGLTMKVDEAGRIIRALERLAHRMLERFPVVIALAAAGTLISILQAYDVFGMSAGSDDLFMVLWYRGPLRTNIATSALVAQSFISGSRLAALACITATLAAERLLRDAHENDATEKKTHAHLGPRPILVQTATGAAVWALYAAIDLPVRADERLSTLFGLVVLAVVLISVFGLPWLLYTSDNEDVLLAFLVKGVAFSVFVAGIVHLGLSIVMSAIDSLITHVSSNAHQAVASLVWTFVLPCVFCSQVPRHTERLDVPHVYRIVVGRALFYIYLLLLAVLYLYIARIALTRTLPSGQLNWFGCLALLGTLFFWAGIRMIGSGVVRWYLRWGWALVIPILIVQLMAIYLRVSAYGLTTSRYASILCVIVGAVGLALAARARHPRELFGVCCVVTLIACVTPANIIDLPYQEQAGRLRTALASGGMSQATDVTHESLGTLSTEEQERIASSWSYLSSRTGALTNSELVDQLRGDSRASGALDYLSSNTPSGSNGVLDSSLGSKNKSSSTRETYAVRHGANIGVAGYSRLYPLDARELADDLTLDFWSADGTALHVDCSELIARLREHYASRPRGEYSTHIDDVDPSEMRIVTKDGGCLALTSVSFQVSGDRPCDAYVAGYVLIP